MGVPQRGCKPVASSNKKDEIGARRTSIAGLENSLCWVEYDRIPRHKDARL